MAKKRTVKKKTPKKNKKRSPQPKNCDCIQNISDALDKAECNTELDIPHRLDLNTGKFKPARVAVATVKSDSKKRGRAKVIIATYCPFCGKSYVA